jgi:hypothetical protein
VVAASPLRQENLACIVGGAPTPELNIFLPAIIIRSA